MSTETESLEDTETSFLERWDEWYHIPALGVIMAFMFWVRTQQYERVAMQDGNPALSAVDSWYHWRTIEWTAENYPWTMPYEIWTSFPDGRYVGQFGTLFDQLIVTAAMIVGLGDPSTETLYVVSLLAVPAMAALVAIPVFYIGRRLGGTIGGLVGVIILALGPGQFLSRSLVGQLQHHAAEVLFMATTVLAFMVALRVAERDQPIYELLLDRDWQALRTPTIYSALAGFSLVLYIWVWPPGVVLVGILAVFFTIQLSLEYARNRSPDPIAFVGAISLGIGTLGAILLIEEPGSTSATSFGYLQPMSTALVAAGCLFMAWFARQWNNYDLERRYYPVAILGLLTVALVAIWALLPSLFSTIETNLTRRVIPFGETATDLTIQEAQPPADFAAYMFEEFGTAFYTMLAGLVLLLARPYLGREFRAEHTLIVVWTIFLISMAATQVRFSYYLILAVAAVNAVFVADVVRFFDLDIRSSATSLRQVEGYQVIVLVLAVMLLFAPLLPPIAADGGTAWEQGDRAAPHVDALIWEDSNHWLNENTPEPGNWGGADNADQIEYFGTYELPEDGSHDYPEGAYGVISWWDYGHLITTQAERIPHSNPFQSNARSSSAFLIAESEERSELILDAIAAGESPDDPTADIDDLEAMAEGADESHEEIRYVMIDDQMAAGKFGAIATWSGPDPSYFTTPPDLEAGERLDREALADGLGDVPYDNTTLSKLFFDDAGGMDHYRLVHENDVRASVFADFAQIFDEDSLPDEQAQQFASLGYQDGDVIYLADGELAPPGEGEPAISINQQVDQAELLQLEQDPGFELISAREGSALKTFERVDGATLTGNVDTPEPENATVTADVELESNTDRPFTYVQEADLEDDGSFEVTVPYATDDELGVEDGYTDSAVTALEEYTVSVVAPTADGVDAFEGETAVPESDVINGETIEVDLAAVDFEEIDEPEEDDDEADLDDVGQPDDPLEVDEDDLEEPDEADTPEP